MQVMQNNKAITEHEYNKAIRPRCSAIYNYTKLEQ